MDHNKEYHDPDYPEPAPCIKEELPSLTEEEKVEKIKSILRREFSNELEARESEVKLIDQRMTTSRRLLHRLRYAVVARYYSDQRLHLSSAQARDEVAAQTDPRARNDVAALLSGQRQLHPSVRKLLGKKSVDIDEIFRTRGPRNKSRKDYVAMLQKRNYTISADATKSLRPESEPEPSCSAPAPPPPAAKPAPPRKLPRSLQPKITNVVTLVEPTRNKIKHRYRIIIGNTSKYVPASSRLDRSTHKWLLYIRGPASDTRAETAPSETDAETAPIDRADLSQVITAATVTLHHSYAPHHIVHLDKPPYHISRRGWGEFPARVELHFPWPERNRPAAVTHSIKLDRNYTGLQTRGSETVVDVWLYSTPEMLPYEFKDEDTPMPAVTQPEEHNDTLLPLIPEIKTENTSLQSDDNWLDFFTKGPTELDVDEMIIKPTKKEPIEPILPEIQIAEQIEIKQEITEEKLDNIDQDNILTVPNEIFNQPPSVKKRIVKYIDPTTGKIYYLEMDRQLDLTKVQEIVINDTTAKISPIKSNGLKNVRKKKGISLLKPEVKSLLKSENNKVERQKPNLTHIENDHCYLATPIAEHEVVPSEVQIKKEASLYNSLCSVMHRFLSVRSAVNYLVKHIPLISEHARDPDFVKHFPFVVENSEKYWKLDFAKRRNIEWSRAKLINRLLSEHFSQPEPVWRTKQILLYIRMHGHYPVRSETAPVHMENSEWSSWQDVDSLRRLEGDMKEVYPSAADVTSLSVFNPQLDRSLNESYEISDDEDVDVTSSTPAVEVKREPPAQPALDQLPVETEEDRLRFFYVERTCRDVGIELRNEDVGNGYSYSAVHAVLVSAVRSFAEELIRSALADKRSRERPRGAPAVWTGSPSSRSSLSLPEVFSSARSAARLRVLTARDLGARGQDAGERGEQTPAENIPVCTGMHRGQRPNQSR